MIATARMKFASEARASQYKLSLTYNAHGDKGQFLVLILHHLYPVLSRSDDTSIPLQTFHATSVIVNLILKLTYKYKTHKLYQQQ